MRRGRTFLVVMLLMVLITPLSDGDNDSVNAQVMAPAGLTPYAPFNIDGDQDLENKATSNGWSGNGSSSNPYVLDSIYIDGNGTSHCLRIENTTRHVRILNSTFFNASSGWMVGSGLYLKNASNIDIVNSKFNSSHWGIWFMDLENVSINARFINGIAFGIEGSGSSNITLISSVFESCALYTWGMENYNLDDIQFNNSQRIEIFSSSNISIKDIGSTYSNYFSVRNSNFIDAENLQFDQCGQVYFDNSNWINISGLLSKNASYGLYFGRSSHIEVSDCEIDYKGNYNSLIGTHITQSSDISMNNIRIGNFGYGAYFEQATDLSFEDLGTSDIYISSLTFRGCTRAEMINCVLNDGLYGIDVSYSNSLTFSDIHADSVSSIIRAQENRMVNMSNITGSFITKGIDFGNQESGRFENININGTGIGMSFYGSSFLEILNCTVVGDSVGLQWTGYDSIIKNSTFEPSLVFNPLSYNCDFEDVKLDPWGMMLTGNFGMDYLRVLQNMKSCFFSNTTVNDKPIRVLVDLDAEGEELSKNCGQIFLFNVQNGYINETDFSNINTAIVIVASTNIEINGCDLNGMRYEPISIHRSLEVTISDCNIYNTMGYNYLTISNCDLIIFKDNNLHSMEFGLMVSNCLDFNSYGNEFFDISGACSNILYSRVSITNDLYYSSQIGIYFYDNLPSSLDNCIFRDMSSYGIYGYNTDNFLNINTSLFERCNEGIYINSQQQILITSNRFLNNTAGINAESCGSFEIKGNVFLENINGATFENSGIGGIVDNVFVQNSLEAVELISSGLLWIYNNSFINNNGRADVYELGESQCSDDASTNYWYNEDIGRGNFWSDLTDPDNNGDGIVDVSYYVDVDNWDRRPLTSSPVRMADTPGNVEAAGYVSSIEISWDEPEEVLFGNLIGYELFRGTSTSHIVYLTELGPDELNYIDHDVNPGWTYYYKVRALLDTTMGPFCEVVFANADDTGPTLELVSPVIDQTFSTNEITLEWIGSDHESEITGYQFSIDDGEFIDVGTLNHTSVWIKDDGQHKLMVKVSNDRGLDSTYVVPFKIDTTSPSIWFLDGSEDVYTNQEHLSVEWAGFDNVSTITGYSIQVNDHFPYLMGTETTRVIQLDMGPNLVTLKAVDAMGHISTLTRMYLLDQDLPVIEIKNPKDGSFISTLNISTPRTLEIGYKDETSGIVKIEMTVDDVEYPDIEMGGNIEIPDLSDGVHTITVFAFDRAQNLGSDSITITIDNKAPTITYKSPLGDGLGLNEDIVIQFSELIVIDTFSFNMNDVEGNFQWSDHVFRFFPYHDLEPGRIYNIQLEATDLAGNQLFENSWSFSTTNVGIISGQIVDEDGFFVSGAEVSIGGMIPVFTDRYGRFKMEGEMGSWELTISKKGMETKTLDIFIRPDEELDIGVVPVNLKEEEKKSSFSFLYMIPFLIILLIVLVIVILVLRKRNKADFEFFVEEGERPRAASRGDEFEEFWIDMGDEVLSDHYQVLAIPRSATPLEIKKAYRAKANQFHPDRVHLIEDMDEDDLEAVMAHINEAKEVLLNPMRRMYYDAWLHDRDFE